MNLVRSRQRTPRRLRGLPDGLLLGRHYPVAATALSRLFGLALLRQERAGAGLVIPRCRSVHTFGMRFLIDVLFFDRDGRVVSRRPMVPAGRIVFERRARTVLEVPSRMPALHRSPRRRNRESAPSPR